MLKFGTSGLRGLITDMTDQECYINALGYLNYLKKSNQIEEGSVVTIAGDLRSSTDRIMRAVGKAVVDAGCRVENAGKVPSPAVMYFAMAKKQASIMVTGSHIPDDRNGIKFNKADGEVLKSDEPGILEEVAAVRTVVEGQQADSPLFDRQGQFKAEWDVALPEVVVEVEKDYVARYQAAFNGMSLEGKKVVVDQHSAVGRDMLVDILKAVGADVVADGRSEAFIPKDTENITEETKAGFVNLAQKHKPFAIVSTDGDSDRPFVVGGDGTFYRGDILGAVVAKYLGAQACAVPVSANDAVDAFLKEANIKRSKTRIGSPYVIAEMYREKAEGANQVIGWEVNGGVMLGSDYSIGANQLKALPTRDAVLPIVTALFAAQEAGSVEAAFASLTTRYTQAGLIDEFPVETSQALIGAIRPVDDSVLQVIFNQDVLTLYKEDGMVISEQVSMQACETEEQFWNTPFEFNKANFIKSGLEQFYFKAIDGFGRITGMNFIDGVRINFDNGDVAHIRPSGNAPQLRIYSNANSQERADEIVNKGLADNGILRTFEKAIHHYK